MAAALVRILTESLAANSVSPVLQRTFEFREAHGKKQHRPLNGTRYVALAALLTEVYLPLKESLSFVKRKIIFTPRELELSGIEQALSAVGELIAGDNQRVAIVVVGGAALNLLGIVRRTTSDVDVIAQAFRDDMGMLRLERAEPFPPVLESAIRTVARDFGLDSDWVNTVIDAQWKGGLPPGLIDDLTWVNFGVGLDVGLAGRRTLVALKLFAAVDRGAQSVHMQDLLALRATDDELEDAAGWVKTQDAAETWPTFVDQVIAHVRGIR